MSEYLGNTVKYTRENLKIIMKVLDTFYDFAFDFRKYYIYT